MIRKVFAAGVATVALLAAGAAWAGARKDEGEWTSRFVVEKEEWTSVGRNPFFVLEPGYQLVLEGGDERLVITVLHDVRVVDGVETRVVEERETEGGRLVEVSRNFVAMSRRTNGVYYFGEEVDIYRDGKVVRHDGGWLAGEDGATFGLLMPGEPLLHARFQQEMAPGRAMDRAEIVSLSATLATPAGTFEGCLKVEETTPLEPAEREWKVHARGIGLVKDESLVLVRSGPAAR